MRRSAALAAVLACATASGCAASGHGSAPDQAAAATAPRPQPPSRDVEPAVLLGRSPDEADVLLRLSVAREHPLGPKLEPFVLAWPGWGSTLRRFTVHPVAELDWIDIVGPKDPTKERLAARTTMDDELVESRLSGSSDGSLRVALRPQPHLVTAVPPAAAGALTGALLDGHVVDPPPASGDEGLRALLPHPHQFFRVIPEEAQSALLRVMARPAGAAQAELELSCGDAATAQKVADAMREQADHVNGMLVRMLTHDLLSGLSVRVEGDKALLSLPASREQLEALAALAAGFIPPQPAP
jgi:hypothetical protein